MKMVIKKEEKGFLLMEAVMAIFIIGASLIVFITVLSRTFQFEFRNRDYAAASGLAQEGVELVRNIRDNNWKEGDMAFDGSTGTFRFPDDGCWQMDYKNDRYSCSPNRYLLLDGDYFYEYDSGNSTKFRREITISDGGDGKKNVESKVIWTPPGTANETNITVKDTLSSWADKKS